MESTSKNIHSCWIVTEGLAGTENQCIGVCEALGLEHNTQIKRIALNEPWQSLSPKFLKAFPGLAISKSGDDLEPPFPDLVLAAGRKAVIAALHIRKASKGKTRIVFLQNPGISPHYFDLVCVPFHDSLRGENVLVTQGAPNRINRELLENHTSQYDDIFQALPSPRIAICIGGDSKRHSMDDQHARSLIKQIHALQDVYQTGIMMTLSRRSPVTALKLFQDNFKNRPGCFLWDEEGENPYFSMLKHADTILATEDSVSMLCDAATTGKPVYRLPMPGKAGKLSHFYIYAEERDIIRPFQGTLDQWSYPPFRDAEMIAEIIKKVIA